MKIREQWTSEKPRTTAILLACAAALSACSTIDSSAAVEEQEPVLNVSGDAETNGANLIEQEVKAEIDKMRPDEMTPGQQLVHFRDVVIPTLIPERDADYEARIRYLWDDVGEGEKPALPLSPEITIGLLKPLENPHMMNGPFLVEYPLATEASDPSPAVLVFPGGGYAFRSEKFEGLEIAEWLNSHGISAFVLNYRLSADPVPLEDARLAMAILRSEAETYNIDPDRIGVMGFSAGGHLAATLSTLYDDDARPALPAQFRDFSTRPDFSALAYPVITMQPPHTHYGTRGIITGGDFSEAKLQSLSAEALVDPETPPAFIWSTLTDETVPYQNSQLYADALEANGVPYRLEFYESGPHGAGLATDEPYANAWPAQFIDWLKEIEILR